METIEDVVNWFLSVEFIKNAWVTIILRGGVYNAPRIIAVLVMNNKNEKRSNFVTVSSYINYLRSD